MKTTFLKIFFILIIILILGLCGIFISKKLPKETSYFIFPVSISITSFAIFFVTLFLLYQFVRRKEIRRELEPEKLEKALYECRLIQKEIGKIWRRSKPTGELYNKSWDIARKIAPNLQKLKGYKTFLQENLGLGYAINLFEKLWGHYGGGWRIKTKGPYKEMGKNLIRLSDELSITLKKYRLNFQGTE